MRCCYVCLKASTISAAVSTVLRHHEALTVCAQALQVQCCCDCLKASIISAAALTARDITKLIRLSVRRPFKIRCCYDCLKASTISAFTLDHQYGVPGNRLEGLRHYTKHMRNHW